MTQLLTIAWLLQKGLSFAGLIFALAGVAVFGWHFVRINAAAARGETSDIPTESWRGTRAKQGATLFAAGVALVTSSILLTGLLPSRY